MTACAGCNAELGSLAACPWCGTGFASAPRRKPRKRPHATAPTSRGSYGGLRHADVRGQYDAILRTLDAHPEGLTRRELHQGDGHRIRSGVRPDGRTAGQAQQPVQGIAVACRAPDASQEQGHGDSGRSAGEGPTGARDRREAVVGVDTRTTFISLCSGGGGLDAGLRLAVPGARCVCYVERELTEAGVLAKGIEAGWLDDSPIWTDLLSFDARAWRGRVDGVIGGFPCQPHSYAGKRLGEHDERNLWPAVARLVYELSPAWCFFENVPGIAAFYWRDIRPDLQALGYEVEEGIFSAEEVGAPHLRERLFWLAHRQREQQDECAAKGRSQVMAGEWPDRPPGCCGGAVADAEQRGLRVPAPAGRDDTSAVARTAGEELGNTRSARWPTTNGRDEHSGQEPATRGCDLVDADERASRLTRGSESAFAKAFPPGPSDRDGWRRWLDEWPGTQPAVRRDADGLAWRGDRLRVLGNGVVPLAAANAYLTLSARMARRSLI